MSIGHCLDFGAVDFALFARAGELHNFSHGWRGPRRPDTRLSPTLQGHDTIDPHENCAYGEESVLGEASESHRRRDMVRNTDATGTAARRRWRERPVSKPRASQDDAGALGRIARRALPMLPQYVQAAVEASLRRDRGAPAGARPDVSHDGAPLDPPYLFVVRAGHSPTFTSLRRLSWVRPDLLGVVYDRRWMGQRRVRNDPYPTERRRGERRRLEPSWTRSGFMITSVTSAVPAPLSPVEAPARLGSVPIAKSASARGATVPEPASRGLDRRWRIVALGLGVGLLLVAASAAGVYLRWLSGPVKGIGSVVSGSLAPTVSRGPAARLRSEPSPPRPTASPTAARFEPRAPAPAAAPRPSTAAVERCVTPSQRTLAVRNGEVLGALVNARIDESAQPPRCLFVVERRDGTLWVVESSRVEARRE
jgi:hypothetical protein